ncbi:uncharacterized protein PV07_03539 [Cladophialophora immunda]|uniref:Extracellular membrane protein CFEM domain-containing protein n=1 Tax=Cladophialophora immunda TaxID=569365 RepID=A0A0D2CLA7_9EURO|nr:uncharacterized protein PV07_03539 [Cladophialophora immunda]KIW31953.1 hypothetical protein PV07_03539 [Cladophialophora immunda]OQU96644.1 hypothetical protein CLAIMM_02694 [Cladophialophora immunda]
MKTSLLLPFVALAVRVLADIPPACLLSAVNTQDQPGDLSSICGDEATDVQKAIASLCSGNAVSAAQSAFISTCSAAGSSVAPYTASSSNSHTSTAGTFVYTTAVYNSDCSCTTTIVTSATSGAAISTGLATATATGGNGASGSNSAGGAAATGNAAADAKQVGSFAAAVIAIAGVVAVL